VSPIEDRVLALAGVFQSARLVQRLAYTSTVISLPYGASMYSVLVTDAKFTYEVFGMESPTDMAPLKPGLELVRDKLKGNTDREEFEIARYVVNLIQLASQLQSDDQMMQQLSDGIDAIAAAFPPNRDWLHGEEPSDELIMRIAELYSSTISHMMPRIIVNGDESVLKNEMTAAKIRAVLMAGIRAAHLWWQLGGRRWHLLFRRKQVAETARRLLTQQAI
jgi:high frequency lysogenization protein